jgi:hypothetical protein
MQLLEALLQLDQVQQMELLVLLVLQLLPKQLLITLKVMVITEQEMVLMDHMQALPPLYFLHHMFLLHQPIMHMVIGYIHNMEQLVFIHTTLMVVLHLIQMEIFHTILVMHQSLLQVDIILKAVLTTLLGVIWGMMAQLLILMCTHRVIKVIIIIMKLTLAQTR